MTYDKTNLQLRRIDERKAHDPRHASFLPVAQDSDFSLQNLPYGVASSKEDSRPRVWVAIGSKALDLSVLAEAGVFNVIGMSKQQATQVFGSESLNALMALGAQTWSRVRSLLSLILDQDAEESLKHTPSLCAEAIVEQSELRMRLPIEVQDFSAFYSSKYHAFNVGSMMRGPEQALQPNWVHLPVAYHGRASSVCVSGTPVRRPQGQLQAPATEGQLAPFGPTRALDFELEMGIIIGKGQPAGQAVSTDAFDQHVFGMVLLNDWSARDMQAWEYVPLGPFLSKNFCTTISPWVVPMEALLPFVTDHHCQDPKPLPYLRCKRSWNLDIHLEVDVRGADMDAGKTIVQSNAKHLYWNGAQQLAHHTIGGCPMRTGDLLGTGTISGPEPESLGCLLELTKRGKEPLSLGPGGRRTYLLDGDEVTLRGYAQAQGVRVGFGEAKGMILPSI